MIIRKNMNVLRCEFHLKGGGPEKSDQANWVTGFKGKSWDRFKAKFYRSNIGGGENKEGKLNPRFWKNMHGYFLGSFGFTEHW